MATHDVARIVLGDLPTLPTKLAALFGGLTSPRASAPRTELVARSLGLPNRFKLTRVLHGESLPGLRELTSWMRVIGWLVEAERTDASLFSIAAKSGRCPAACYRLAKRLTGLTWTELRARGSTWATEQLVGRCREIGRQMCR